jgi:glycosyltransferase involved in cell wall biosynthesis
VKVTCCVPTKARHDTLPLTLLAIAFQTHKEIGVIVVDDNDPPTDLRNLPAFQSIFHLFNERHIPWQVVFGRKLGQHHSHQMVQEMATTDWIWRVDDDEVPELNVLERLLAVALREEKVGAVGGLVLPPSPSEVPDNAQNLISDLNLPNVQWFRHPTHRILDVEHLHSTFLYRRGIEKYNLFLSPAAHREETLFTYGIKRQGYKLLVDTGSITWHFRALTGGIRSHQNAKFWEADERIFQSQLAEWGINSEPVKPVVLDCGRGDHVIVKSLLPRLKEKYGKLVLATSFRDIFEGEEQISIAEAYQRFGPLDRFSIYRWCIDHNWTENLVTAFEKLYGIG